MVQIKHFHDVNSEELVKKLNKFLKNIYHEDLLDVHYINEEKAVVIYKDNIEHEKIVKPMKELLTPSNRIAKSSLTPIRKEVNLYDSAGVEVDKNLTNEEAIPPVAKKRGRPRKIN